MSPQSNPAAASEFLSILFSADDTILFRGVETWTECAGTAAAKKQARNCQKLTHYRSFGVCDELGRHHWLLDRVSSFMSDLNKLAAAERANLFYGVCPRWGTNGLFDKAWQIPRVRSLWCDIDNVSVVAALAKVQSQKLPPASLVVSSGNGAHLYWLLAETVIIHKQKPIPVHTEWIEKPNARREPKPYYFDPDSGGEKTFLTPGTTPALSPTALQVQDTLAGIAAAIGGDHTQDLSRLLRIPGSLNRKDQRNGRTPVLCELVEAHPERKYHLQEFSKWSQASPLCIRREKVAQVHLPAPRRITPTKQDRLVELVNACAVAEIGERSERDFKLCCQAIEQGWPKDEVWSFAADAGKFAERGREYFDRTWAKAEGHTREMAYNRASNGQSKKSNGVSRCWERPTMPAVATTARLANSTNGYANGHPVANTPPQGGPQANPALPSSPTVPIDHQAEAGEPPAAEESDALPLEAVDDPHRLARLVCEAEVAGTAGVRYWRDEIYLWDGRKYRRPGAGELRGTITKRVKAEFDRVSIAMQAAGEDHKLCEACKAGMATVSNVIQAIQGMALLSNTVESPSWLAGDLDKPQPQERRLLACRNGLLDLDAFLGDEWDNLLLPHDPRWFSTSCLDFDFNLDAKCPKWNLFLQRNLEGDEQRIELLQEWFGYCLTPDISQQKFLMMEGEGRNGKSVICKVLATLVGESNISSVRLEDFGERFQLTPSIGKLVNIVAEVGELDRVAEGALKSFTSGDYMQLDRKGLPPVQVKPTAKLVIATNTRPRFVDRSEGLWRRLILFPLNVKITDEERIYGMDSAEYWLKTGEMTGILTWALDGLYRLQLQKTFTKSPICENAKAGYQVEANPAREFLKRHCSLGDPNQDYVICSHLYRAHRDWALHHGYQMAGESTFFKEVQRAFPGLQRTRPRMGYLRPYRYLGLKLKLDLLSE